MKLAEIRKSKGIKQSELGAMVGVSNRVVSAWERGETVFSLFDACRVADALDCSLDELAGRPSSCEYAAVSLTEGLSDDDASLVESVADALRGRR